MPPAWAVSNVGFATWWSDIERRQPEGTHRCLGNRRLTSRLVWAPRDLVLTVEPAADVQFLCAAQVAKLTLSPLLRCTFDHGDS
ncbi:hypothetical protein [Bradyrhizobium sp. SZCCHNR1015]|uniref:hypothetical protein n=1 Tax=Bradyrhizobium sp. SZCCHNR1015 TaxID=3057338 RepID=UPI002916E35E|nr:hypothetical protein [Bradyrhizobium sp. SZCCHNR1015]